jgi:hypothetical protein
MRVTRGIRCLLAGSFVLFQSITGDAWGAGAAFSVNPSSGPPGAGYEAVASGPGNTCPSPSDVVIVAFFDAAGRETESEPIPVQPDGSWRATLNVPAQAAPGQAEIEAGCHASATSDEPSLAYTPTGFMVTS